ncbi:uncharacterized protein KGF55_001566 [Candida pseudojiufengensis]|uniref:uncharacterized protein n=1 Tax=Candida pseudojiufengensis TaxID=497109 RepID=UPI0022258C18|nr:uncharacterized protein KGF55_001566 [Candida pseudojiufengensis]KAI5965345.1 hypothetical protein KGF55_001566 [Candida pseudojiufengensis]
MQSNDQRVDDKSTNSNRPRSGSALTNWKKQAYKQYQPKFLNESDTSNSSCSNIVPLPSIECFQLQYILNDILQAESQQVIDDLLKVATNYQNDLRNEIKRNLSIEQKIQFKNISICKNIHLIFQTIHQRKKKLKKQFQTNSKFNHLIKDPEGNKRSEINQLVIDSVEVSARVKSTIHSLQQLESKLCAGKSLLDPEKYPNLCKLINKTGVTKEENKQSDSQETNVSPENTIHTQDIEVTGTSRINDDDDDLPPSIDLSPKNSICSSEETQKSTSTEIDEEEYCKNNSMMTITKSLNPPSSPKSVNTITNTNEDEIDPHDFEQFMSTSIANYRTLQRQKIDAIKHRSVSTSNNDSIEEDDVGDMLNVNSIIEFPPKSVLHNSPLNLLYSQLMSNPKYRSTIIRENEPPPKNTGSNYPFASLINAKSPATIKSTGEISHFKKLRINGSPLNTEHYRKVLEKESKIIMNEDNDKVPDVVFAENLLETLVTDSETRQKPNILNQIDDNDKDELWNSSGLTSEDESEGFNNDNEHSRTFLDINKFNSNFSSTSDSETDSDADYVNGKTTNFTDINDIRFTNKYYSNLEKDVRLNQQSSRYEKRKTKKRNSSKTTSPDKQTSLSKESSPTPKHKPSHHILHPKRSILKTQTTSSQQVNKSIKILNNKKLNDSSRSSSFENRHFVLDDDDFSPLYELNVNYNSNIGNIINKHNVNGTIVTKRRNSSFDTQNEALKLQEFEDDGNDQESISILKSYVK